MSIQLHFDLVSGIAGDMAVGALIDLGVPIEVVEGALAALELAGCTVEAEPGYDVGMAITALKFKVLVDGRPADDPPGTVNDHSHEHGHDHGHDQSHEHSHGHDQSHDHGHGHDQSHDHEHGHDQSHDHEHGHDQSHDHEHGHDQSHEHSHGHGHGHSHGHDHSGSWASIKALLHRAPLAEGVRTLALEIFEHVAHAEARVHGMKVEDVAFHEVGAVDSIADIVAVAACVHHLAPAKITCSSVPLGRGFTWSQHGRIPVPAPATLFILKGVPVVASGLEKELVTPTGAAIIAALVDEFVEIPAMTPTAFGHGAGTRRLPDRPNMVRAMLGRPHTDGLDSSDDLVIEANLDDMSGELCGHVTQVLLDAGALDVWWTPIVMKKGRPAQKLSVLSVPEKRAALVGVVLAETTTLGLRTTPVRRYKADRSFVDVETPHGSVRVKVGRVGGVVVNVAPEFESARSVAVAAGVPLKAVLNAAIRAVDL